MGDWYASSTAYAAVPQWAATTAYTVGQFVRSLATPAQPYLYYVHRCTTAGTTAGTEPAWSTSNNGTTASGTATFTNVTGQSTYGWSAAAGTLYSLANIGTGRTANGDRVFISSDSSESEAAPTWAFGSAGFGLIRIISVNRAGSVPPVAADEQSGAAITISSGTFQLEALCMIYWQGVTFTHNGVATFFNSNGIKAYYFKNCAFVFGASATKINNNNPAKVTWDNTTVQFGATSQGFLPATYNFDFTWLNTPSAIVGATIPTTLFTAGSGNCSAIAAFRGVDLSAITGTLVLTTAQSSKVLLDGCRIASAVTRLAGIVSGSSASDEIELVNCYDGTNTLNERYTALGVLTTDRSTTMSAGASDSVGAFSFKLVSNANADRSVGTLDSFYLDVGNSVIGSSRTATVEIISSASLNNNDIRLTLFYMGTSGTTRTSLIDSVTELTTAAALPTSSATWNNPPSTPVKQYLQVTFTPQVVGRVRARVRLGKPSTTVWINPQLTLT